MPLPPGLNKERIAEKKLGQIPTGKKTGIVRAMIDTRGEPDWDFGIPAEKVLRAKLPAGDVMCQLDSWTTDPLEGTKIFDQVLIERKTPDDFLGTLAKNRLFPQIARMVQVTPWSYVVITGLFYRNRDGTVSVNGRTTGWNYDAIEGAKLSCQELGVGVVHCAQGDFEGAVKRLCNRDRSVKRVQPARETALLSEGEQCIAALPGIGHERVQALTKELGNPVNILAWLTDLTSKVKVSGVADGTKRRVKEALGLAEWKLDAISQEAQPFYLPDEQGSFIATTPEAYDWICELWKEKEHGD